MREAATDVKLSREPFRCGRRWAWGNLVKATFIVAIDLWHLRNGLLPIYGTLDNII
jgi:hypothetical protein